ASYHTTGVDFGARYSVFLENAGRLKLFLDGTWLNGYVRTSFNAGATGANGVGNYDWGVLPRLKFNTAAVWSIGPVAAGISARYIGRYKECNGDGDFTVCYVGESQQHVVPHYLPVDAFVSYALKGWGAGTTAATFRSEELTSEIQSPYDIVCRVLLV